MAKIVKRDGTTINLKPRPPDPKPDETGLVGWISNTTIHKQPSTMLYVLKVELQVDTVELARNGGMVPHFPMGGRVRISKVD